MLTLGLALFTPPALGAQCNATASEVTLYSTQLYDATSSVGQIYEIIVTTSAIYISSGGGERIKILPNYSFAWAIVYGTGGY